MRPTKDKPLHWIARCAHCGKAKNQHRAGTLKCPKGKRTSIGYVSFGPRTFKPEPSA
jgi:hypothetical protein